MCALTGADPGLTAADVNLHDEYVFNVFKRDSVKCADTRIHRSHRPGRCSEYVYLDLLDEKSARTQQEERKEGGRSRASTRPWT